MEIWNDAQQFYRNSQIPLDIPQQITLLDRGEIELLEELFGLL